MAASFLLTLALAEGALRLLGYSALYEVYSKPSLFWTEDALLGWRHEAGASGTYVGPRPWPIEYRTEVRINSLGLRGPEIAALPPGGFRILVLGDSLVAGFEVEWQETFPVKLEEALGRRLDFPVQVINAGVRGYGTDQAYLYYRSEGRQLDPDLVVMVHSENDAEDNATLHRMRRPFGKPAFALREDGSLELVGHPVERYPLCSQWGLDERFEPARFDGVGARSFCWLETRLADRSALFTFVTLRIRRSPGLLRGLRDLTSARVTSTPGLVPGAVLAGATARAATPVSADGRDALTLAIYRELAAAARADGAGFLAVIANYRTLDTDGLAELDIPFHRFVLRSRLLDGDALRFENDAHFNALGHRLFAENLTPALLAAIVDSRGKPTPATPRRGARSRRSRQGP